MHQYVKDTVVYSVKHKRRFIIPVFLLLFISLVIFVYFTIFRDLPSPENLKNYQSVALSTHLYDRNGKLLYEIYHDQNRTPIKLSELPPYIAQATIAIEDKDFYTHPGVSITSGLLRIFKEFIFHHNLEGGSTLTQQLVKNALLSPERTIQRKAKEIIVALWTEKTFTKKQILEMYLNQVPYGGSAYGIEEASKTYFDKQAKDLTIAEAALLAGLPQAPSLYSPFVNPDYAVKRRNEVLQKMQEQKYITKKQYDTAVHTSLAINPPKTNIKAPHFVFYVKSQLEKQYGTQQVEEGGMQVTTTLDLDLQEKSEQILKDELAKLKNMNVSNGAVLITRPGTGEILTMVGSADYYASPSGAFNVTTALRQPGSAIKPLNYAVGIDRKLVTPATVFLDVQTCFPSIGKPYCPVNYDGKFHGPVQLRFALGNSFNIPAVKMLQINGINNFIASASAFGITTFTDPSKYGLSLTLGGGATHMTDMAQAFSTFANRGISKPLVDIVKITDKNGKVLYQLKDLNYIQDIHKPLPQPNFFAITGKKVISPETAFLISHILLDNNARTEEFGPSSALVVPKHAVSVKTGTTNDFRDNWTFGFTPNFLVASWVGNNDNSPMSQYLVSGITGAAPIWNKVMSYVLKNQPDLWPIRPDTVVGRQVCNIDGSIENKNPDGTESCPSRFEYFIQGTEGKTQISVTRQTIPVNKDTGKMTTPNDPSMEMREQSVMKDGDSLYCVDCAH